MEYDWDQFWLVAGEYIIGYILLTLYTLDLKRWKWKEVLSDRSILLTMIFWAWIIQIP